MCMGGTMSGPTVYNFENKIIKQTKVDSLITLTVSKNLISGKIFVEFLSKDGKLKLQRNFDNTVIGIEEARKFESKTEYAPAPPHSLFVR